MEENVVSELSIEQIKLPEGSRPPIATWSGTIELEYSTSSEWEVRLHDEFVAAVFPDVSAIRRTRHTPPRVGIVTSTRRYYGLLHRSLLDLVSARPPSADEVLDLLCQYHGSE